MVVRVYALGNSNTPTTLYWETPLVWPWRTDGFSFAIHYWLVALGFPFPADFDGGSFRLSAIFSVLSILCEIDHKHPQTGQTVKDSDSQTDNMKLFGMTVLKQRMQFYLLRFS